MYFIYVSKSSKTSLSFFHRFAEVETSKTYFSIKVKVYHCAKEQFVLQFTSILILKLVRMDIICQFCGLIYDSA